MALVMAHSLAFQEWTCMNPRPEPTFMFQCVLHTIHGHFASEMHLREALLDNWELFRSNLPFIMPHHSPDALLHIQQHLLTDLLCYLKQSPCPRVLLQTRMEKEHKAIVNRLQPARVKDQQLRLLQRTCRDFVQRCRKRRASMVQGAVALQRTWRGCLERREKEHRASMVQAAAALQRTWRGFRGRRRAVEKSIFHAVALRVAEEKRLFEEKWHQRCRLKSLATAAAQRGRELQKRSERLRRSKAQSLRAKEEKKQASARAKEEKKQASARAASVALRAAQHAQRCAQALAGVVAEASDKFRSLQIEQAAASVRDQAFHMGARKAVEVVSERVVHVEDQEETTARNPQEDAAQLRRAWNMLRDTEHCRKALRGWRLRQDLQRARQYQRIPLQLFLEALRLNPDSPRYNLILLNSEETPKSVELHLPAYSILPLLRTFGGEQYAVACFTLCAAKENVERRKATFCAAFLGFLGLLGTSDILPLPTSSHTVWKLRIDAQHGSTLKTHRFICAMPINKIRDFTEYFALDNMLRHVAEIRMEETSKKGATHKKKRYKEKKWKLPTYDVHIEHPLPVHMMMHKPYEQKLQSVVHQQRLLKALPNWKVLHTNQQTETKQETKEDQ